MVSWSSHLCTCEDDTGREAVLQDSFGSIIYFTPNLWSAFDVFVKSFSYFYSFPCHVSSDPWSIFQSLTCLVPGNRLDVISEGFFMLRRYLRWTAPDGLGGVLRCHLLCVRRLRGICVKNGDWMQRILRMAEVDKLYGWPNANCWANHLCKCTEVNRLLNSWNVFWWNVISGSVGYELCRSRWADPSSHLTAHERASSSGTLPSCLMDLAGTTPDGLRSVGGGRARLCRIFQAPLPVSEWVDFVLLEINYRLLEINYMTLLV